jgi:hypothetical protein
MGGWLAFGLLLLIVTTRSRRSGPSESSRELAKRAIDEARQERRRFGECDGRGECTSVLTRELRGRLYCDDCGRPRSWAVMRSRP